jgi:regulatory protein
MPQILSRRKNKNHYQVTIAFPDGHVEEVKVSEDLIVEFRVSEGRSYDDRAFASFQKALRLDAATQDVLRHLKRQPKSAKEVRELLLGHALSETDAQSILAKLTRLGVIDDRAFALHYVDYQSDVMLAGPKRIAFELSRRGIPDPAIQEALASVDERKWDRQLERLWMKHESVWTKKPMLVAVSAMKAKFFELGYPEDAVARLLEAVLPAFRQNHDEDRLLREALLKVGRQLRRETLDDKQFQRKLIERLIRKGFRYEAIKKHLAGGSLDESEDFGF